MIKLTAFFLICLFTINLSAQNSGIFSSRNFTINGYVDGMNITWVLDDKNEPWNLTNTATNRFDIRWYPTNRLTAYAGVRNILTFGGLNSLITNYDNLVTTDFGYFDLTFKIASGSSSVLYSNIDRANLEYTTGNLDLKLGRQRVNWSQNLVWNPNDMFNTSSYFDFSYIEKPGSDAISFQYYTGAVSSFNLVG